MVKPFQFARLPKIYYRNGIFSELKGIISQYGKSIILVTGEKSFLNSDRGAKFLDDLKSENISVRILTLNDEPSPEFIDCAVEKFIYEKIDVVVGVGGGSVLDAGKAIAAMMYRTEPVTEFLEGIGIREHPGSRLPYIAVPTTSGTGSEATKNAVLSRIGTNGFKRSLRHDNFVPDVALIDPALTLSCPADITAASGMDCFTQLTEAFLSDKSSAYTDSLALEGLKEIRLSLKRCYDHGDDIIARSGMSFAALTSGVCLANAGLGAVHGFASSIGGLYNIPHGLICGTLMASANDMNVRKLRQSDPDGLGLKKYARLGELFLEGKGKTDDYLTEGFIQYLYEITNHLCLKSLDIPVSNIDLICRNTEIKNNPVKLTTEDLAIILRARIT